MSEQKKPMDKNTLAIAGGLMLGLGVGLFFFPKSVFFQTSIFAFTGCIILGLGVGLLAAAILATIDTLR